MQTIGLLVLVAWTAYEVGRVSPDPLKQWEVTLRRRTLEWRVWWIEEHIKKAELRRDALIAAMKGEEV